MTTHLFRRRDSAVLASLAIFLCGCVSASGVRLGTTDYPPRPAGHALTVYDDFADAPAGYLKVGRIVGEGSDLHGFAAIVDAIRQRARELGGDAIVLTGGGLLLSEGGPKGRGIDIDRTVHAVVLRWP